MAQRGINKVILIGNLGQDPEVRYSQNSTCFANLSLATSESWKDKQTGQLQEKTEWHRVSIIGKLAEIAGEYLRKGSKVYIEGKLQTRKWQGQDGKDNYTTEVVVDSFSGVMQMLDGKDGGSGQGGQGGQSGGQQQGYQAPQQPQQQQHGCGQQESAPGNFVDDIPFAPLGKQCRSLLNVM